MRQHKDKAEVGEDEPALSKMKDMLDTVDKVRTTLGGLKNNQVFYEELLASLPQFVCCGPQSAGKSSVIRRVSGVSLPEASTLCTRIATIIQMRRSNDISTRVTLTGLDGKHIMENTAHDGESVRNIVEKAQAKALKLSPSKQFVEDHTINVHVTGPELINVTLVDLPGFHTADDEDTKTVNDMVKRYVEMPGTLVLHVVKGDQDYASLLGNDFMRKAPKHDAGRVTVLTHCDKIDNQCPEDVTRLQTTLDTTASNSTLTVALLGCANNDEEEQQKLKHLTQIDHRLDVGATELSTHLEDRMKNHLYTQFPKAVTKLETSLSETIKRIESVRERSPIEVLCEMVQVIRNNFLDDKKELMNDLRIILDKMTTDIKNFVLRPSCSKVKRNRVQKRDNFDEELEPGQLVYATIDGSNLDRYFVKKHKTNDKQVILKTRDGEETITKNISELWSGEIKSIDYMVEDIEKLACDRGIRNIVHADRQPIIEAYAKQFADHYTGILEESLHDIQEMLDNFFDEIFSYGIHDIARPVATYLRKQMRTEIEEAFKIAKLAIEAMSAQNTNPDLIFTPNEHYLNTLVQKMVAADTGMASDSGGARHIYHNIRAFIKVQRKYISELASKELIRTTIVETETRFDKLLNTNIGKPELMTLIEEPSKVRREREILSKREKVLEDALALAKECY